MNAKQFVESLGNIPFSQEVYKQANYTDNLISDLLKCYIVKEKMQSIRNKVIPYLN
jgi:hypothetical protein